VQGGGLYPDGVSQPAPLEIHCAIGQHPLPYAWVVLTLPMLSKNPYRLLFGPSGADGVIRVSSDELRAKTRAEIDFFPMDYSTFPDTWTGTMGAEVVDLDRVRGLRSAMELWGSASYPPDFEAVLNEYEARLQHLDNSQLNASVVAAA
jgi:hypothetical protein